MSETAWSGGIAAAVRRGPVPGVFPLGYAAVTATPWSAVKLGIGVEDEAVTAVDFLPAHAEEYVADDRLAAEAVRQLGNYFRDPRRGFTLPLAPSGTPFQHEVWHALRRIPVGATSSYGALARRLGSSARAVGGACRANPIAVIIPCHRVVAAQGLGGFMGAVAGHGLDIKRQLLGHESSL